jgi:hypothetical protein
MNDVEVAVELEALSRLDGVKPHKNGRGCEMTGGLARDREPVIAKQICQRVEDRPGISGRRGHCDQAHRGVQQPVAADVGADALDRRCDCHRAAL